MKKLVQIITGSALTFVASHAVAHSGGHSVTCKSEAGSSIQFALARSNGSADYAPSIKVFMNGKEYVLNTPSETKAYGKTVHDSPLGVIVITAESSEKKGTTGYLMLLAIPKSVKAFDIEGKPLKWNPKAETDDCYDANGSAKFKGILRGYLIPDGSDKSVYINGSILDCELTYNSGMRC